MPVDLKYLREHYASLSDEALAAIDRTELVKEAQQCYDQEFGRRKVARPSIPVPANAADDGQENKEELPATGDEPDWLDEAAEIYSRYGLPGSPPADDIMDAEQALNAAGIPCHLDLVEEEKSTAPLPTHRWRVMVPGNLNFRATSILERDIFNSEFEAGWKAHLEMLSDDELRATNPQEALCGLFDRVDRVINAYDEEIARRAL
ncbi:MAG: hypothetical protein ABSG13_03385 [Bryobacteraceae bacterium]|jgi:hypothetical protein